MDIGSTGPSAPPDLFARHQKVYPKAVTGFFRRLKWRIMVVTLAIYYLTPWLRWERGPSAPDQAVLVDLANRRFYFFTIEIWPQEFYYVAGLLIMAGIGLFLVTSTVGRAWCGYFCPQTVWTDLYQHIERYIDGDRNAQIRLEKAPWSASKFVKRAAKHSSFLLIAAATGGAWVFYFADAPTLLVNLFTGEAAMEAYVAVGVLTFTTYSLGGLMREQVCTYMCPWPRIQGAMLDDKSLVVTYNDWRGEPRGKHRRAEGAENLGDCVDCDACVAVCPVGIDIRNGQQLECITCALCIDACDTVMEKLGKPKGLIGYSTLQDYNSCSLQADACRSGGCKPCEVSSKVQGEFGWRSLLKPRSLIYIGVWSAVGVAMLVSLYLRDRLDVNVLHDRNPHFVMLSDGSIRNGYTIKILNMRLETRLFELKLEAPQGARMRQAGEKLYAGSTMFVSVGADRVLEVKVFVEMPKDRVETARQEIGFTVNDMTGVETAHYNAAFFAPERYGVQ
ncbi:MAG: cytochrome c oxidase accessory protein CcoG [Rhodobacteraceae bacterium]|nr:cytochrome c oxidase accessory protein CcoG [Paracoccaceae bacterium]